jgi:hypothetical protein
MRLTHSVLLGSLLLMAALVAASQRTKADAQEPAKDGPVPIEKDMHEFMEYVFEPTFNRLKAQMASAPADTPAWKAIKSDSLILAESCNLLLLRAPEDDAPMWLQLSGEVRNLGGQLYQAAKKKDYKSAQEHYGAMVKKCNACHQKFAHGEHQLTP